METEDKWKDANAALANYVSGIIDERNALLEEVQKLKHEVDRAERQAMDFYVEKEELKMDEKAKSLLLEVAGFLNLVTRGYTMQQGFNVQRDAEMLLNKIGDLIGDK